MTRMSVNPIPNPDPNPTQGSADVAEGGVASIGVRSSGNLCVEYVCLVLSAAWLRGNGVIHRGRKPVSRG